MVAGGKKRGKIVGGGIGIDMYTLPRLKWITTKDLLYSTQNSAQCRVATWMGREFGGKYIHGLPWWLSW